jgi:16S rRNA (uracil1498-N3)-methyltransferase
VNLFYQPLIDEGVHYLDEEESRHCIKVLRKRQGEPIHITDGKGLFYEALIAKEDPRQCAFRITGQSREKEKNFSIHVAIAPTKNTDRIEWFVEKSVEIGIDHITLLDCKNSERSYLKSGRLKKVAISAMKQSFRATLPALSEVVPFHDFITTTPHGQQRFIAYVDASNPLHLKDEAGPAQHYVVLIGPEGDFSDEELGAALAQGYRKVSLGKSRLRTETAGVVACHILNLINS